MDLMKVESQQLQTQTPYTRDKHPGAVYLTRLAVGSRGAMTRALNVIADMLRPGDVWQTLPWHKVRYSHTTAIRAKLAERYAPATANKMLSALRGVLQEVWRLGYMNAEEYARATDLPQIKGQTLPSGRALSAGELSALFRICDPNTPAGARDAAILAVLYGAGLRRSELVALDLKDYNAETGELTVKNGKGGKDRIVYAENGAFDALEAWMKVRGLEQGPLFLPMNKAGQSTFRRMSAQNVRCILQKRAHTANVGHCSPHDMRRTFISDLLDAGADISSVQKLAGHSSPSTTSAYDRRGERAKRKAAAMLHIPYVRTV